ncbi:MAG: carbohydrate ABC transporter permease [Clostridia bacterium]|jgi:multiple sugar transport system permease protein|nr:carbohydrate ABC transporter permease [Clostridia bacterium]MEE0809177.1 carbohydrate ABC transporter permease [Acutalibacteraceae bacterium]
MNNISPYKMKRAMGKYTVMAARYLILISLCYVILYPLFSKLSISFMTLDDLYDQSVNLIPHNATLHNFKVAIENVEYLSSLLKTLLFTFISSLLQIASSLLVGYGFARFNFKGKNIVFACVLLLLIVPAQNVMTPLYFYFNKLGLLGTPIPMFLISATSVGLRNSLYIYMFRQYFKGFPKELEEAGAIDGAGTFKVFTAVLLPCAVTIIFTCFVFSFVWLWTDTFYTTLFMPDNTLLQTRLLQMPIRIATTSNPNYASILRNVSILLLIFPLMIIYLICQRFFVESVERSGIVG